MATTPESKSTTSLPGLARRQAGAVRKLHYYRVAVSSSKYHGSEPLTYSYKDQLKAGSIVAVTLRNNPVVGIILGLETNATAGKIKAIERLIYERPLPDSSLKLLQWLRNYYPAPLGTITQQFVSQRVLKKPPSLAEQEAVSEASAPLPDLTKDQQAALKQIRSGSADHFLLHGEVATGKTRIYIELVKDCLASGRSAIILVPEISLTPQAFDIFTQEFNSKVLLTHSEQTPAQRLLVWQKTLESTGPRVIIGPRSAVFSPLEKVGLIVADEAHEPAYKQEQAPYYQTTRVAAALARIHGAKLVLGTATPLISDYYFARAKQMPIIRLQKPAIESKFSRKVSLINLKDKGLFSSQPYISKPLIEAIQKTLDEGGQSLIFLNRRGSARRVLCQNCFWTAECPQCSLPYIYHGDDHILRCHSCGRRDKVPNVCPVCGSSEILFKSIGTKALESMLGKLFPKAIIKRFDTDVAKADRSAAHFSDIVNGQGDILVGTQMIAKGLDLPKLGLVGVIFAESSLTFPDYTAEERTYQLIRQVVGRIGRGHRAGQAIIQTYNPDSPTLKEAIAGNWEAFYDRQLAQRQLFGFPPYYFVLKLQIMRANRKAAESASLSLADLVAGVSKQIKISSPMPCFVEKQGGKYCWQLIVKSKQRSILIEIIKQLPSNVRYDIDPTDLL